MRLHSLTIRHATLDSCPEHWSHCAEAMLAGLGWHGGYFIEWVGLDVRLLLARDKGGHA